MARVVSSSGVYPCTLNDRALQPIAGCHQNGSRMFNRFSVAAAKIPHLVCCALVALALAGCGGDGSAATSAGSTSAATQPFIVNGVPPTSVRAGAKYQYIPSANADGRTLSFSITNKPDWATFGETNGELSGVPEAANIGTTPEIQIVVSDGTSQATVGPFRITVAPPAASHLS